MELIKREFPAGKGIREFKTIVMREVNGSDEIVAGNNCDVYVARYGEKSTTPLLELMLVSIVSIDGVPTNGVRFDGFDKWTSKARNFVLRLFNSLNAVDEDDLKAILAGEKKA